MSEMNEKLVFDKPESVIDRATTTVRAATTASPTGWSANSLTRWPCREHPPDRIHRLLGVPVQLPERGCR